MPKLSASVALLSLFSLAAIPAASAQTPVDFAGFNQSCMGAATFLLGQVPPEVDSASILTPLCGCLQASFGALSQADVDELAADLGGTSTDESHAAHGDYERLLETASSSLQSCYAMPEVIAALDAAQAIMNAQDPATPATPEYKPADQQPVPEIKLAPSN